jgi:hypothetical protein
LLYSSGLGWRHANFAMRFHEVVIAEVESNRSLKVLNFLAERIGEPVPAASLDGKTASES